MLKVVVIGDKNDNFSPTLLQLKVVKKHIKKLIKNKDIIISKSLKPFVKDYLKEFIVYAPDGMYNGDCITDLNFLYQDTVLILDPKDQRDIVLNNVEVYDISILLELGDEPVTLFEKIDEECDCEDFKTSELEITKESLEIPSIVNTFKIKN